MQRVYLEYQGDCIELPIGETVIGRDVGCGLRVNDPSVSRRHVRFERRLDCVYVEDLASANGTLVNDQVLDPRDRRRLSDRDRVSAGTRVFTLRIDEDTLDEPSTVTLVTVPREYASPEYRAAPRATSPLPVQHDRRRSDRSQAALRLTYTSDYLEVEATTRDLSANGVFVCTQMLDPIGTKCSLEIFDGDHSIIVDGVVRRVHGEVDPGLGVEFVGIDSVRRAWLEAIVARHGA